MIRKRGEEKEMKRRIGLKNDERRRKGERDLL